MSTTEQCRQMMVALDSMWDCWETPEQQQRAREAMVALMRLQNETTEEIEQ